MGYCCTSYLVAVFNARVVANAILGFITGIHVEKESLISQQRLKNMMLSSCLFGCRMLPELLPHHHHHHYHLLLSEYICEDWINNYVYIQLCTLYCMGEYSTVVARKGHSPNLDTIRMIEQTIESHHDFGTVTDLYNALPRGVQHATFKKALAYLEESNKIAYDKNGAVFWIFVRNKPGLVGLEKNSIPLK